MDVVEIDRAVAETAKKYFLVREDSRLRIHIFDAFDYLQNSTAKYDAVYVDTFLGTNGTDVINRMKTKGFLGFVKRSLHPQGVISFNLHLTSKLHDEHVKVLRDEFPFLHLVQLIPKYRMQKNIVALAALNECRLILNEATKNARVLDRRMHTNFNFSDLVHLIDGD